jgi:hypothetical protein
VTFPQRLTFCFSSNYRRVFSAVGEARPRGETHCGLGIYHSAGIDGTVCSTGRASWGCVKGMHGILAMTRRGAWSWVLWASAVFLLAAGSGNGGRKHTDQTATSTSVSVDDAYVACQKYADKHVDRDYNLASALVSVGVTTCAFVLTGPTSAQCTGTEVRPPCLLAVDLDSTGDIVESTTSAP